jgi:hypothetical protein
MLWLSARAFPHKAAAEGIVHQARPLVLRLSRETIMKLIIAALIAASTLTAAGAASAAPWHHHHQVCIWRHHHRICHWG